MIYFWFALSTFAVGTGLFFWGGVFASIILIGRAR